jgi:hypothetical protein
MVGRSWEVFTSILKSGCCPVTVCELCARSGRLLHFGKAAHVPSGESQDCDRILMPEQSVLSSPVCLGTIARYGHYSSILAQSERNFSAVQTAWRRERDSNPRYPFRHSGFQDVSFSPPSLVVRHLRVGPKVSKSDSEPLIRQLLCSALCSRWQSPTRERWRGTQIGQDPLLDLLAQSMS